MKSTKAQSFIEFIIVTFIFCLVVVALFWVYIDKLPSQYSPLKEQIACSHAETLANLLYNSPGAPADWKPDQLMDLGFSNAELRGYTDYVRWQNASAMGFNNIINKTGMNYSFYTYFKIYSFNLSQDGSGPGTGIQAVLIRDLAQSNLTVYAIDSTGSTAGRLNLKLFVPFANVTGSACSVASNEAADLTSITSRDNGTDINISWEVSNSDCRQFELTPVPYLIYIKEASFVNQTNGTTYPISFGAHTNITMSVGSEAYKTVKKNYCAIERKGLIRNQNINLMKNETFGAYYYLVTW